MATTTTDRRQGVSASQAVKVPVRAATTANITLSGEQTIDGVACVADDRVLVKDQTDGSENGIYIVSTGSWTRAPDFDGSVDVVAGTLVPTSSVGASNGAGIFQITNTGTITIGTTSLTFTDVLAAPIALMTDLDVGTGSATTVRVDVAPDRTGNGTSVITLYSDTTATDETATRFLRYSGSNSVGEIRHYGTGELKFVANDAADIELYTNNTRYIALNSAGQIYNYSTELFHGHAASTADIFFRLGNGRTGSGNSFIDLVGDTTYTTYGLRIIRSNGGANTTSQIIHRGTGNLDLITDEAAPIVFSTNSSEVGRWLSGGGLTFNGDTAAANAIDDYEEGTWTPAIEGASTAGSATYSTQIGSYRKIGSLVICSFEVGWSGHTGTGNMHITGLPFTTASGFVGDSPIMTSDLDWPGTANGCISCYISGSVSYGRPYYSSDNATWTAQTMDAAGSILGTLIFEV